MLKLASHSQNLEDAFHIFSQVSERLTESYHLLEQRVAELTDELAAARDERLQQLAEKERLAHRLQSLLGALPAGVVVLDGNGVIQECNPVATALLGAALVGEKWTEVTARLFVGAAQLDATLRDGRQLSMSTCDLGVEPGRIILLQDVTETRRLQDLLSHHQRLSAMGEMVARVAHQIRTPLTSAMLYASMLRKSPAFEPAERVQCAEKVLSRLRQLERTVNDMLVYARGGEFAHQPIAVAALLDELRQALELQLQQTGGHIDIVGTGENLTIDGVRDVLLGALLNIVTNAIQAADGPVRLRIETRRHADGGVELRIGDNGPGIADDIKHKIFEPFFTTRGTGTGLGLAVVRAVMEGHRGTVAVESQVGSGATFVLTFPAQAADQALLSGADRSQSL